MVKRFGNCTSEMIELSNDLKAVLLPSHVWSEQVKLLS